MHVTCSLKAFIHLLQFIYFKLLMYVVINYQKGEIESTFAPLVVLVIHVNIHIVGLMLLSSIF